MRVLQNVGIYPSYAARLAQLTARAVSYEEVLAAFRADRFEATHLLEPVLRDDPASCLTIGNFTSGQHRWAEERGQRLAALEDILLSQIEAHRADVFYNLDPARFDDRLLRRLPGCVKQTIAWSAAPLPHHHLSGYGLVVNNFPGIRARYAEQGCRTAAFSPSFDPEMAAYAQSRERPTDVLFVGGYSRHHLRRAGILEAVAALAPALKIEFHLDLGRLNRLAELPLLAPLPLAKHRRPATIRAVAQPGVFGRDLYAAVGRAKIVLNAAVDMAGDERGNIRCFEAMGCGALLLSDAGKYPAEMQPGKHLVTYADSSDVSHRVRQLLAEPERMSEVAAQGHAMLKVRFSKAEQWQQFTALCT